MFRRMLVMLMLLIAIPVALTRHPAFAASGRTFYVDCLDGNDSSTGLSQSLAWKTMSKANKSLLVAGDSLLFKRGCTWTGTTLTAHWSGTASAPVTIGTYGTDARLAKVADASISVTGVYQVVEGFEVTFKPVKTAACGQPLGQYYALVVTQGGSNNTIQHNLLTHATAGIHISKTAGTYNKVYYNTLAENNVMQEPFDGSGDLGAWGMLVRGSHTDIAYNTFLDNRAVCTFGKYFASNSVEIYEGDFNNIHHNVSQNDRVFSELGGSSTNKASDNTYSFNLVVSNLAGARFITTRGALDTSYGPVYRTVAERNTVFFSGVGSQGMVCSLGCSSNILTARYNIIQAEEKGVYFDQTMGQKANMYWSSTGTAKIQDGGRLRTVGPSSTAEIIVANPSFADPTNGNFRLRSASPAVDAGGATGFQTDLDQAPSIAGVAGDIGGYEFQPPPPPPATTVAPPLNTASATSMSPATLGQGSTWRTVKLTGTGFEAGSTVAVSGGGVTVKSVTVTSPTLLTLMISVSSGAALGSRVATVNSPGHAAVDCSGCFDVGAGPTIASITPGAVALGQTAVDVDITGANFADAVKVGGGGDGITIRSVTRIDSGHLHVSVDVGGTSLFGVHTFSVVNTDGGKATVGETVTS